MHSTSDGKLHKRKESIGPGGWNCPCCAPSKKNHRFFKRLMKKRAYKEMDKIESMNEDIENE